MGGIQLKLILAFNLSCHQQNRFNLYQKIKLAQKEFAEYTSLG